MDTHNYSGISLSHALAVGCRNVTLFGTSLAVLLSNQWASLWGDNATR